METNHTSSTKSVGELLTEASGIRTHSIPKIYAKAALQHSQIDVKKRIGCDGIEIQLLGELVNGRVGNYYNAEQAFDLDSFADEPVSVVHAPILQGVGDMTIEQMCDVEDCKLFYETCRIAEFFGKMQSKQIIVVVHSETYLEFIGGIGDTLERIELSIQRVLDSYPHVCIGIENVSPLRGIGKGGDLHLANNFKFDNVHLAKMIREDLGTDRVGTVLDTCHAMLADKYITALYKEVADRPFEDLSMEAYFKENVDTIFLIHLCDIFGSGYGKGRHGVPFTNETKSKCESILNLYKRYNYNCPITLEVEETDFSVCDGYKSTKGVVNNIISKW